jgi:hypothetical protein
MSDRVEDEWEPPPLLVSRREGKYLLEDGNHRYETLRRSGATHAWVFSLFTTKQKGGGSLRITGKFGRSAPRAFERRPPALSPHRADAALISKTSKDDSWSSLSLRSAFVRCSACLSSVLSFLSIQDLELLALRRGIDVIHRQVPRPHSNPKKDGPLYPRVPRAGEGASFIFGHPRDIADRLLPVRLA